MTTPLSEFWKQQQEQQLTDRVKTDTYNLIRNAMENGKSGIKLTCGRDTKPALYHALIKWLADAHGLQAKYVQCDPKNLFDVFFNTNQANQERSLNQAFSGYLEVVWDQEGWNRDALSTLIQGIFTN